jgi:hypothetical protein
MKLVVDEQTLTRTTKCMKGFSCLSGEKECLCEIENNRPDGSVCFIRTENNLYCDYGMPFGFSYICTCPTRKEIHNRYHI